jgi:uncharacterized protein YdhG (YjbR/CyaY superfamily)
MPLRYTSVDEYISLQPAGVRVLLRSIRAAIRKALPDAEEAISYQIPAFKLAGRVVVYFAGWKEHVSIYPASGRLKDAFKRELASHDVRNATIRFPLARRVPATLIGRIAKFRAKEVAASGRRRRVRAR